MNALAVFALDAIGLLIVLALLWWAFWLCIWVLFQVMTTLGNMYSGFWDGVERLEATWRQFRESHFTGKTGR